MRALTAGRRRRRPYLMRLFPSQGSMDSLASRPLISAFHRPQRVLRCPRAQEDFSSATGRCSLAPRSWDAAHEPPVRGVVHQDCLLSGWNPRGPGERRRAGCALPGVQARLWSLIHLMKSDGGLAPRFVRPPLGGAGRTDGNLPTTTLFLNRHRHARNREVHLRRDERRDVPIAVDSPSRTFRAERLGRAVMPSPCKWYFLFKSWMNCATSALRRRCRVFGVLPPNERARSAVGSGRRSPHSTASPRGSRAVHPGFEQEIPLHGRRHNTARPTRSAPESSGW